MYIDSPEKFSIKGFLETSFVDWPGNICAVLFLPHCNFRCPYCHNADLVLRPETIENISFASVMARLRKHKGWIDGVCVSGGEPTIHSFLPQLLSAIKKEGFLTKLDTNGSHPDVLSSLINDRLVDYIAMDIKAPLAEDAYCKITGAQGVTEKVRQSVAIIRQAPVPYEFRFTVLPSYHQPADIYRVAEELSGAAKLTLQNFKPKHTLDPLLNTSSSYRTEDLSAYQQQVNQIISQQVQ
jgi:pyruvate formate lyase activating enzyme